MSYILRFTKAYENKYQKITKRDIKLKNKIIKVHQLLSLDPHNPVLQSHKVNAVNYGLSWSSRISGDIRVVWKYDSSKNLVILVLMLGFHSGNDKVYQ